MDGRTQDPTQFETLRRANKYRRAFTWRVGRGNSESRAETTGLVHLATSDYPLAELELAASSMEQAYHHHIKQWGKGLASRGCSLNIIAFTPNVALFQSFPSTTALASNS
jgi:hypothetical protein